MHPVLRLVKDDGLGAFKHLVGDLHGVTAEGLAHLLADGGLVVVEGGQTVHEHGLGAGLRHQLGVDLIGGQVVDALLPDLHGLAHGHPHVGVDHVGVLHGRGGIGEEFQRGAGLGGNGLTLADQRRFGEVLLRGAGHEVHTHFGAAHHQGVAHVVAGVAHVHQLLALQAAAVLLNGQEVRQNLGGVELIGQAVPHGNVGVLGQLLHNALAEAAVLDAVKHAAQDAGGVGDALLFADLGAAGVQIGDAHAQIMPRHLEGAAGTGAGLFKDQGDVLALTQGVGDAGLLLGLQLRRQLQQVGDLLRGKVQQLEKILVFQTGHDVAPSDFDRGQWRSPLWSRFSSTASSRVSATTMARYVSATTIRGLNASKVLLRIRLPARVRSCTAT